METKFFIGLDVHTVMTQYAVRSWKGDVVAEGKIATTYRDVKGAVEPYLFSCVVGMEASTSFYPLRDGFLQDDITVKVANVLRIRALVSTNDKLDALRLSDMLRLGSFPESYIPTKDVQVLRDLVSVRHTFLQEVNSTQSRIWAALSRIGKNIHEKSIFSKKGCSQINDFTTSTDCPLQVKLLWTHYQNVNASLEKSTQEMILYAEQHFSKEWLKLQEIAGIGKIIASYLIAEIHPIIRFQNIKKLRRYAGVIPCFQQSAGKTYGGTLPKTSSRTLLRWALVQAAHGAIRTKKSSYRAYYNIKKKKGKQKAIMSVARVLCDKTFTTLSTNTILSK